MTAPTDQQLLTEAKAALHALNLGQSVVEARDANGDMVRYTPANASRLRQYIKELETKIAGKARPGPLRPRWN